MLPLINNSAAAWRARATTRADSWVAAMAQRLLVISNRLPVTIKRVQEEPPSGGTDAAGNGCATGGAGEAQYEYAMSSGGLVSALSGLKKLMSFTWIGWPGMLQPWAQAMEAILPSKLGGARRRLL